MNDYSYSASASTPLDPTATIITSIVVFVIVLFLIASMWKIFKKAGQPGWAAIVPYYNFYILIKIADRPTWWFLLFFVPFANIIVLFILYIDIAKAFGKSAVFGIFGLGFFSFIGWPMLGFGKAEYTGAAAPPAALPPTPPVGSPPAATPPVAPSTTPPPTPPATPPAAQ